MHERIIGGILSEQVINPTVKVKIESQICQVDFNRAVARVHAYILASIYRFCAHVFGL